MTGFYFSPEDIRALIVRARVKELYFFGTAAYMLKMSAV